jgi:hypothetical protein
MDFLNQELKTMLAADVSTFEPLQIKPSEIDDIELMKETKISFFDEDEEMSLQLIYYPQEKKIQLAKS